MRSTGCAKIKSTQLIMLYGRSKKNSRMVLSKEEADHDEE